MVAIATPDSLVNLVDYTTFLWAHTCLSNFGFLATTTIVVKDVPQCFLMVSLCSSERSITVRCYQFVDYCEQKSHLQCECNVWQWQCVQNVFHVTVHQISAIVLYIFGEALFIVYNKDFYLIITWCLQIGDFNASNLQTCPV